MSVSTEILSAVKIGDVNHALTGLQPRRTGRDTWRGKRAYQTIKIPAAVVERVFRERSR